MLQLFGALSSVIGALGKMGRWHLSQQPALSAAGINYAELIACEFWAHAISHGGCHRASMQTPCLHLAQAPPELMHSSSAVDSTHRVLLR